MTYDYLFGKLWEQYSLQNPSVFKIHQLFTSQGETMFNDHIAFRTFNDKRINITVLAEFFKSFGYETISKYQFKAKKLNALHLENGKTDNSTKIFISELILEQCSSQLQQLAKDCIDEINPANFNDANLLFMGNLWGKPSYETYQTLREESEYAAWLYVYGFRANHFTVSVNSLKKFDTIEKVNDFLKNNGFVLNNSGGEIKGNPEMLLQQSSTMADIVKIEFKEGNFEIPSCYYEFALRYKDKNGEIYNGFHEQSADKIFESTNFYRKTDK